MSREDSNNNVLWFVAGAAIGATVAILFAPASGEETRRKLRRSAEKGRERIKDTGREIYGKGRDLYEKGKDLADDAAELFERGRKIVEG
jgi:gas vesicle protein